MKKMKSSHFWQHRGAVDLKPGSTYLQTSSVVREKTKNKNNIYLPEPLILEFLLPAGNYIPNWQTGSLQEGGKPQSQINNPIQLCIHFCVYRFLATKFKCQLDWATDIW